MFKQILESVCQNIVDALNEQKAKEEAIEVYEVKRELPNNDNQAETQNSDQDR